MVFVDVYDESSTIKFGIQSIGVAEKETTVKRVHSGIVVTVKATLSKYPVVMRGSIKIFKVDEIAIDFGTSIGVDILP